MSIPPHGPRIPARTAGVLQHQDTLFTRRIALPAQQFIYTEGASGRLLFLAAVIALIWANSPWSNRYDALWEHVVTINLGFIAIAQNLRHWVNDGAMTLFFFLVTLEVKRELIDGELSTRQKAALPVAGALGGLLAPAAIYLLLNAGGEAEHGWGIPIATDTAFALGALAILGRNVPAGLVTFLLAMAVVDDIAALSVVAFFYTDSVNVDAVMIMAGLAVTVIAAQRLGIRATPVYWAIGAGLWLATYESGIHATIAGVILAALTPTRAEVHVDEFFETGSALLGTARDAHAEGDLHTTEAMLGRLSVMAERTESPLERMERHIHPWTGYLVLPLFALANAGVALNADSLGEAMSSSVAFGVFLGLWIGKPLGVLVACWLALRLRLASTPSGVALRHLTAVGALAGIGFSVSIFITELAFPHHVLAEQAKVGILAAAIAATALAGGLLRLASRVTAGGEQPEYG